MRREPRRGAGEPHGAAEVHRGDVPLSEREERVVAGEERRVEPGRRDPLRHERRDGRTRRHADEQIEEAVQRPMPLLERPEDPDFVKGPRDTAGGQDQCALHDDLHA